MQSSGERDIHVAKSNGADALIIVHLECSWKSDVRTNEEGGFGTFVGEHIADESPAHIINIWVPDEG